MKTPSHIAALRDVIKADLRRLAELEERLTNARGPTVSGIVKSVGETCSSLSAACVRLGRYADELEPETVAVAHTSARERGAREASHENDDEFGAALDRMNQFLNGQICQCGKVALGDIEGHMKTATHAQRLRAERSERAATGIA